MGQRLENEELIVRYLLGELSAAEQSGFEATSFNDDGSVERIEIVRNELIDDYLLGGLPDAQRERFEKFFLRSPQHRQKLAFAKALQAATLAARAPESNPVWQTAMAFFRVERRRLIIATAILLMALAGYLLWRTAFKSPAPLRPDEMADTPKPAVPPQPPDRAEAANANQNQRLAPPKPAPRPPSQVATFGLSAALRSPGEATQTFVIKRNVQTVNLQIDKPKEVFKGYKISLTTSDGKSIWHRKKNTLQTSGNKVTIAIPARRFASRTYALYLKCVPAKGQEGLTRKYSFKVEKR